VLVEQLLNERLIAEITLDDAHPRVLGEEGRRGPFERRVVVIVEIVEHHERLIAIVKQPLDEVPADEASAAGDQNGHARG
jgi:hypothetical protein